MSKPPSGSMVYWRFKGVGTYHFGYVTCTGSGLIRLGRWNGDIAGGSIVDPVEIEWKPYND